MVHKRIFGYGWVFGPRVYEASLAMFAVRLSKRLTSVLCSLSAVRKHCFHRMHGFLRRDIYRTAEYCSLFTKLGCHTIFIIWYLTIPFNGLEIAVCDIVLSALQQD